MSAEYQAAPSSGGLSAGGGSKAALTYQLRPTYRQKASVNAMQEIIRGVLEDELAGRPYQGDMAPQQTRQISDSIKDKLKELKLPRYKFVVQAILGEQRGEGIRVGNRCFWDADTDSHASETYVSDHLFCVVTAYAVYLY
ncbi:unnamed protein product [Phaeothamnion confervicola]